MDDKPSKDLNEFGKQVAKNAIGVAVGTLIGKFGIALARALACGKGNGG